MGETKIKALKRRRKIKVKAKTWMPSIKSTEEKKDVRKLANAIDPQSQKVAFTRLRYAMRKCRVPWTDIVRKRRAAVREKRRNRGVARAPDILEQYAENDGKDLSYDKVSEAVSVLLKLLEDNKTQLFTNEGKDIYLQITTFKVPHTCSREIRVVLPHSLLPDPSDVCLFTSDLQKGKRVDHAPTLEHFKDILGSKGVTKITEVITMRQLKTEYDQYELKRALCNRFDIFLSDAKVCGHITHLLGKVFYDRKKIPIPIKLDADNLKERIETALHKTSYRVHNKGTLFLVKVANTLLTPEQIYENIMAVITSLNESFPGKWDNVLQLMIKGAKTIPIPFYMSTARDNTLPKCVVKPLRPKAYKDCIGELPGVGTVCVRPTGEIDIIEHETLDDIERDLVKRDIERRQAREEEKLKRKRKTGTDQSHNDDYEYDDDDDDHHHHHHHHHIDQDNEGEDEEEEEEEEEKNEVTPAKRWRPQTTETEDELDACEDEDRGSDAAQESDSEDSSAERENYLNALENAYLEDWETTKTVEKKTNKSQEKVIKSEVKSKNSQVKSEKSQEKTKKSREKTKKSQEKTKKSQEKAKKSRKPHKKANKSQDKSSRSLEKPKKSQKILNVSQGKSKKLK